jgi:hypothetical protein
VLNSDTYIKIFGRTRIGLPGWKLTTDLIEFSDFRGSFRYTTSLGAAVLAGGTRKTNLDCFDDARSAVRQCGTTKDAPRAEISKRAKNL